MRHSYFFLIIALILALPLTTAFGVSPASTSVLDPDGNVQTLRIINTQVEPLELQLVPEGNVAQFIQLSQTEVSLRPGERVDIPFVVRDINVLPGTYTGGIGISQKPSSVQSTFFVQAVAAVLHKVEVVVPQQGKHVRANVLTDTPATNEEVLITVATENIGTENINSLNARIDVRGPTNDLLFSERTPSTPLSVGSKANLVTGWVPQSPGTYLVEAVLQYDGITRTVRETITIGSLELRLGELDVGPFSLGDIVRLDLPVSSDWNQPLPGVFGQVQVYQNGEVIDTITTGALQLPPRGDGTLSAFWNTAGLAPGQYVLEYTVFYGGETNSKAFTVDATINAIAVDGQTGTSAYVSLVLGALIILAGLFFVAKRFITRKK